MNVKDDVCMMFFMFVAQRMSWNHKKVKTQDWIIQLIYVRQDVAYTENNIPSNSSLHYGRRHNFDFGKSIKVARR